MKKTSANPDKLLVRAQHSTTKMKLQVETLDRVLATFETLIEQGDPRLAPREVPEDLNPSGRLLWVKNELEELAPRLDALCGHSAKLLNQLEGERIEPAPGHILDVDATEDSERTWQTQRLPQESALHQP